MTKRLVLLIALAACHKKREAEVHEVVEVVSIKTNDSEHLDATVKVMPPSPGTLVIELIDDTSPTKQRCTARIKIDKLGADGTATATGPLDGKCKRPIQPAGFYAKVTFERGADKPVLTSQKVYIPGYFGGTNQLVDAAQLEQEINARVKAAAPPEQPHPSAEVDGIVATVVKTIDSVPAAAPDATIACPPALHGKLYLLPFELALAIRNHTGLTGWALDVDLVQKDPVYDLVRYRHGEDYQPASALVGKTPAFVRITEIAIPGGASKKGVYAGGIYVLGDDGKIACQAPVKIELTANDRASWATQTREKLEAQLATL